MGTTCTHSYVSILMSEFEEKYIYLLIKNKFVIYLCYIEDIFMVWIKSKSELIQFVNNVNQKHQSIKFKLYYIKLINKIESNFNLKQNK